MDPSIDPFASLRQGLWPEIGPDLSAALLDPARVASGGVTVTEDGSVSWGSGVNAVLFDLIDRSVTHFSGETGDNRSASIDLDLDTLAERIEDGSLQASLDDLAADLALPDDLSIDDLSVDMPAFPAADPAVLLARFADVAFDAANAVFARAPLPLADLFDTVIARLAASDGAEGPVPGDPIGAAMAMGSDLISGEDDRDWDFDWDDEDGPLFIGEAPAFVMEDFAQSFATDAPMTFDTVSPLGLSQGAAGTGQTGANLLAGGLSGSGSSGWSGGGWDHIDFQHPVWAGWGEDWRPENLDADAFRDFLAIVDGLSPNSMVGLGARIGDPFDGGFRMAEETVDGLVGPEDSPFAQLFGGL